jgi:hypothetical protein
MRVVLDTHIVVSSHKHLHSLGGQYNGIPIVKANDAVGIIESS